MMMTRIDSVMHPQSSSRGRNTSASVTVTTWWLKSHQSRFCSEMLQTSNQQRCRPQQR